MTLLELITKAAKGRDSLIGVLTRAGLELPDLKPQTDEWIALLNTAVEPGNLAAVGAAVLEELKDIAHGKINPKDHASGAI